MKNNYQARSVAVGDLSERKRNEKKYCCASLLGDGGVTFYDIMLVKQGADRNVLRRCFH